MSVETGQTPEVRCMSGCEQLKREFQHLRSQWLWLFLFGILLTVCGTAAVVFPQITVLGSLTAVVVLGIVLMVAGISTIIASFWTGKWSGLLVQLLAGIFYLVLGLMITERPLESAMALTLFVAAFFIVAGGFRIAAALVIRFPHWGWALLNGIVTFMLGMIIFHRYPQSTLVVLGLLVGIEMLLHGWTWIMLSLAIRDIPAKVV
jgi:uncharacterized membrane protein HdeD (DUF308 family)